MKTGLVLLILMTEQCCLPPLLFLMPLYVTLYFCLIYHLTALTPGRQSSLPVIARMFDKVNLAYRNYSLEVEQVAQQVRSVHT